MKDTDVQMQIRINPSLKKTFIEVCQNQDQTASQVLRDFIRKYIMKNGQGKLL